MSAPDRIWVDDLEAMAMADRPHGGTTGYVHPRVAEQMAEALREAHGHIQPDSRGHGERVAKQVENALAAYEEAKT